MQRFDINPTAHDPNAPRVTLPAGSSAPQFGPKRQLQSPDFWTNLKDFLTERSVKIPRSSGPGAFHTEGVDSSFSQSLKAFFQPAPRVRAGEGAAGMAVDWQPAHRVFWNNLRDLVAPRKLPPLKLTSKPVPVKPLWAKRREFSVAQTVSIAVHGVIILLIVIPIAKRVIEPPQHTVLQMVDVSPYLSKLPPGKDRAGGGGGGGERRPEPATQGKVPHWQMTQITPPMVHPNPTPKLSAEATLLGPPDLKVPSPNDPNFGDPLSKMMSLSGGPGGGSGIGTGEGTGIGSGSGPGLGPGYGGGTGGGAFRPGTGGVGYPACLYCPEPQYSEDARKAKFQGIVVLEVIIQPDGHATNIKVVKGAGLGLDERALEAVRTWRFKPAVGPGGTPVATITDIEVNFRLL